MAEYIDLVAYMSEDPNGIMLFIKDDHGKVVDIGRELLDEDGFQVIRIQHDEVGKL